MTAAANLVCQLAGEVGDSRARPVSRELVVMRTKVGDGGEGEGEGEGEGAAAGARAAAAAAEEEEEYLSLHVEFSTSSSLTRDWLKVRNLVDQESGGGRLAA